MDRPGSSPESSSNADADAVPDDPLDEFFFRPGETGPDVPGFGPLAKSGASHADEDRKRFLGFLLGSAEYAIEIDFVREIVRPPPITEVPRSAPHILGVVTVRGEVMAVLDPRRCLKLRPEPVPPGARIVICDAGDGPIGLLVDGVSQVVRLPPAAIEPRPQAMSGAAAEFMSGIGRDRGRFFILLDIPALLRNGAFSPAARSPSGEGQ